MKTLTASGTYTTFYFVITLPEAGYDQANTISQELFDELSTTQAKFAKLFLACSKFIRTQIECF